MTPRFFLAIILPFAALGLQWMIWPWVKPFVWFLFFPAVFFSARLGGFRSGLVSTVLSIAIVWYFFLPPQLSWAVETLSQLASVGMFLLIGILFSQTQSRQEQAYRKLEAHIAERTESLRMSEARLAGIINSAMDAIVSVDEQQRICQFNAAAEQMFGVSAAEIIGQPLAPFIPARFRADHDKSLRTNGESGATARRMGALGEVSGLRANGEEFPMEASISHTTLAGRKIYTAIVRDITERKSAEAERQKFISLAEQSTEFIGMCDMSFMPIFANEAAWRMVGLDGVKQALGTPVQEFFFPEDQAFVLNEFFPRVLREGRSEVEIRFRHFKTGEALWMIYNVFFVKDVDGQPVGLATVSRNITERKRAEEALRTSEERLRRRNEQLALLSSISQDLIFNHRSEQEMLTRAFGEVARIIGAEMYFNYQPYDEVSMRLCHWSGLTDDERTLFETMRYGELLCGRVAVRRQPIIVEDIAHTDMEGSEAVRAAGYGAYAGFPLLADERLLGTIAFITRKKTHFAEGEVEIIHAVCDQVAAMLERTRLTKELKASEERQLLGAQVAGLALAEVDYRTGLNHLSAEAARLFGLGEEPMVLPRAEVHSTFHAEDAPDLMKFIATSLEPGGPGWFNMDHRVTWPDGQTRWLRVRKQVFFDGEGSERHAVKAVLAALDVTVEKESAETLLRSATLVRNVINSLPALVVVLDGNGTVRMVNDTWNRYAEAGGGESGAVSVGANYFDVCRRAMANSPEAQAALDALEEVHTGRAKERSLEYPCQTPAGMKWFLMQVQRLAEGGPGLVISHTDITERRIAEQLLRDSEARYRTLLGALGDGVFIAQDYRFVFTNPALPAMLGYSDTEFVNMPFETVIAPEFLPTWTERFDQRVGDGQEPPWNYELRLLPKTGQELIWVELRAKRIQYLDKPAVLGLLRDITERKKAENMLRASEQRLRLAIEASALGIWEWNIHTDQIRWDAQMFSMYGVPPTADSMVHYQVWRDAILPEDLPLQESILRETARNQGRSSRAFGIRRPSGEVRYIEAVETVRVDANGETEWVVGTSIDVTGRKLAEDRLRAAHDTFYHLVQYSPFGVYVVDADFLLVQVSQGAQKVFENVRPQIGRDFADVLRSLWPEPFASEAIDQFRHTLKTGESYHSQGMVEQRKDIGVVESYDWKIERITLPDGDFGVVCHFYDLSERQHYEAALRDADRRKDEFLATLAHELRNPLAPIYTGIQVLRMGGIENDQTQNLLETMNRQMTHMVRLVDDLMEVSRISRGKIELKKERIDLRSIVHVAIDTSQPWIEAGRHKLEISLPSEPLWSEVDPIRLTQILTNLLNNAAKYTEPGGRIEVVAGREEREAVLRVRDNGIGIPAPLLDRVFDLFSQVDRHLNRAQGGLGIGLALVRQLVEMHGGRISAHSEGEHQGSEFTVVLPLIENVPETSPAPAEIDTSTTSRRVLIVDDNCDAADSHAILIKLLGAEARAVYGGAEALEVLADYRPDLIILDLGMPGMDGFETARLLRQRPEGQMVQLVALSGWGQEEDRQRTHDVGFDSHLVKPVDYQALHNLLKSNKKLKERSGSTE